jgi:LacI family transcriptional regulator
MHPLTKGWQICATGGNLGGVLAASLDRTWGMNRAERRIGVIVPGNIEIGRAVLRGVRAYCNAHPGTEMEVISTSGSRDLTRLSSSGRDCIVAHADGAQLEALRQACRHVVSTSNRFPVAGFAQVLNDDEAVGRMGARYLLERGFDRLMFLSALSGPPRREFAFSCERRSGFVAAARDAGMEPMVVKVWSGASIQEILHRIEADIGPVGIMAASDLHARWFVEAFADAPAVIPEPFAVLGVDDDPLEAALCPVGLSSVRLAGERLGYEAAALGMRLAGGERAPEAPVRIPPLSVVTRQSTSIFATDDPVVARALRLMSDRMAELGDASDVVRATGVPRRTLEWHFNRALQSTVARELAHARMRRARDLLMTTSLSVKEIAYLVGFSEPRMLSLVFKRETGETPSDFRSRLRPGAA